LSVVRGLGAPVPEVIDHGTDGHRVAPMGTRRRYALFDLES
jgi:hypothetical protein